MLMVFYGEDRYKIYNLYVFIPKNYNNNTDANIFALGF